MPATTRKQPALSRYLLLHFLANVSQWADIEETLREAGLGRPHTRLLFVVYSAPGISINEVLSAMHAAHQNLAAPIKKLVREGYVVIEGDPADGRKKLLHLTAKGARFVDGILKIHNKRLERVVASIDAKDFDTFLRVHALLVDRNDEPWFEKVTGLSADASRGS
jgi:DNA-binding MarR family transcriptional regulator